MKEAVTNCHQSPHWSLELSRSNQNSAAAARTRTRRILRLSDRAGLCFWCRRRPLGLKEAVLCAIVMNREGYHVLKLIIPSIESHPVQPWTTLRPSFILIDRALDKYLPRESARSSMHCG